jgi:hypothetical protein
MKIAIVLNTFNNLNNVEKVLKQFKLIQNSKKKNLFYFTIIDDCSDDYTYQGIERFIVNNNLVVQHLILNSKNIGISESRNIAIKQNSDKDYITFIDGDDHLDLDEFLSINFDKFNCDLICSSFIYKNLRLKISYENLFYKSDKIFTKKDVINYFSEYMERPNKLSLFTTCWSKFYKLDFLSKNNIFFNAKLNLCEDTEFVFKVLSKTSKINYLPKSFYIHTISSGIENLTKLTFGINFDLKHQLSFLKPSKVAWQYLHNNKVYKNNLLMKKFNHLITSYLIIYSIRSFVRPLNFFTFYKIYCFWKFVLKKRIFKKAIKDYSYKKALGNRIFSLFLKNNMVFLFMLYSFHISNKRYLQK